MDAFRPITATSGKFQPSTDCDLPRQASILLKIVTYIEDYNYGDHTYNYTVRTEATHIMVPIDEDSKRKNLVEVLVGGALLAFIVMTFTGYFIYRYMIMCSKCAIFLEPYIQKQDTVDLFGQVADR